MWPWGSTTVKLSLPSHWKLCVLCPPMHPGRPPAPALRWEVRGREGGPGIPLLLGPQGWRGCIYPPDAGEMEAGPEDDGARDPIGPVLTTGRPGWEGFRGEVPGVLCEAAQQSTGGPGLALQSTWLSMPLSQAQWPPGHPHSSPPFRQPWDQPLNSPFQEDILERWGSMIRGLNRGRIRRAKGAISPKL